MNLKMLRGVTWDDWRLPRSGPIGAVENATFSVRGDTDLGYGITSPENELAHLYYVTLGNLGYCGPDDANDILTCGPQPGAGPVNRGPFLNYPGKVYWTGTESELGSDVFAYTFRTTTNLSGVIDDLVLGAGLTTPILKRLNAYAWAVRDGDVAAVSVPEPATLALLGIALAGLGFRRRKRAS